MADKYINATKLIERLKEERAHRTASAPWDFAFAGTMLEISTRRVLNAVIEVLEGRTGSGCGTVSGSELADLPELRQADGVLRRGKDRRCYLEAV